MHTLQGTMAALVSFFMVSVATAGSQPLATREELLKGSWIPEKREFPIDPKISPCQDLYKHSCGKALSQFKMRDDRSYHAFAFSDSHERLLHAKTQFLKKLTAENLDESKLTDRSQDLRNLYLACMNGPSRAEEERAFVAEEKKLVDGIKTHEQFQKMMSERIDSPNFSIVGFGPSANQDDPKISDLMLSSSLMSLPERSYYDKKDAVADLQNLLQAFFETIELKDAKTRAKRIIDFEKKFSLNFPLPAELRDRYEQRNYVDRSFWTSAYPSLKLETFLAKVPGKVKSRNLLPETMAFMNETLAKGDLELLKDLELFHQLNDLLDDAYPAYHAKKFAFSNKHLGGPPKRPAREERCTRFVMSTYGRELDAELLPILFPKFPEKRVVAIAETVRKSLIDTLKKNEWLSAESRTAAIKKMKKANLLLVKPEREADWDFNPPTNFSKNKPIANLKEVERLMTQKVMKRLYEPRNRTRWLMSPLTVNAYYMPPDNTFVLPIGILQPPFFDETASDAQNIASIGAVVGHELGHGVDDKGSMYDAEGRLKQWMTAADLSTFSDRGSKFIAQFDKIGHNGKLTLGENIGDHVGISSAYQAAFPNNAATLEEKQAFFRHYALLWCNEMRPSLRESRLKTDSHSMGEARTNEQVKHIPGFYEAFACKKGDALYLEPGERIRVW